MRRPRSTAATAGDVLLTRPTQPRAVLCCRRTEDHLGIFATELRDKAVGRAAEAHVDRADYHPASWRRNRDQETERERLKGTQASKRNRLNMLRNVAAKDGYVAGHGSMPSQPGTHDDE